MTNLAVAGIGVVPEFGGFERDLQEGVTDAAKRASENVAPIEVKADTSSAERGLRRVADVARVVAGAALVAGFVRAIQVGEEYASTVRKIGSVTGDTAEESSRLAFVLDRIGVNGDSLAPRILFLSRQIEQGGKNFKQYFDDATLAEFRTQSFAEILPTLAARFQELNSVQQQNVFLQNVFGRSGNDLRKLLSLTADDFRRLGAEAEEFGLVLTQENIESFKQFAAANRELQQSFKGLGVQIGLLTIPVLREVAEFTTSLVNALADAPEAVRVAAGVFALLAIGVGRYGQALSAAVSLGASAVNLVRRLTVGRAAEAVATATATAAEVANAAAATAEAEAHNLAAAAAIRQGNAEAFLASRAAAAAAAQSASAAAAGAEAGGSAVGGAAGQAAGRGLVAGVRGVLTSALPAIIGDFGVAIGGGIITLGVTVAAAAGAAIGTAIQRAVVEPILDRIDQGIAEAGDRQEQIDALGRVIQKAFNAGELDQRVIDTNIRALNTLHDLEEQGKLTAEATARIFSAEGLTRIRRAIEAGEDVAAVIRQIAEEANDGINTLEEMGATIGDFVGQIARLRAESAANKVAQIQLSEALKRTGIDTEAGTNVLAHYAQRLFEAKVAAAELAGEVPDYGKLAKESAEEAAQAASEFEEAQKRQAEAVEQAQKRLADAIEQGEKRVDDAERSLADAIEDRAERIAEAEERIKQVRKDAHDQVRDAKERLDDFEVESAKRVQDAERAVVAAIRARRRALADAAIGIEEAQIAGDAEAEAAARRALASTQASKDVDEAERRLGDERSDRAKERARLEEDLADARVEAAQDIAAAQRDLQKVIEDTADRVAEAHRRLRDAQEESREAIDEARAALDELNASAEPTVVHFQQIAKAANDIADALERAERTRVEIGPVQQSGGGTAQVTVEIPGAASGAKLRRGDLTWVGERGIELFAPDHNGRVVSNDELARIMGGTRGGDQNITVYEAIDAEATAAIVAARLVQGVPR